MKNFISSARPYAVLTVIFIAAIVFVAMLAVSMEHASGFVTIFG